MLVVTESDWTDALQDISHLSVCKPCALCLVAHLPSSRMACAVFTWQLRIVMTCVHTLVQRTCYLSTCIHACCCSAGLVSAEFGHTAQSCIVLMIEGTCPAPQPITLPVNGLVAADSTEPAGCLPHQMVWLPVSILTCRTGLTGAPMRQLSINASADRAHPPNCIPGVSLLRQLARAAAAQGLQDSLASCKSASTALVAIPTSLVTADPVRASQAKAGGSMQALRQPVADVRAESGAQPVKVSMTVVTSCTAV